MQATSAYADFSIKARCASPELIEQKLTQLNARFDGEDFQTDTYYEVPVGKLKLRQGNIENLLTHYVREKVGDKMKTTVFVYEKSPDEELTNQYLKSRQVIGRVVKRRKIYWIANVKFHIDHFERGESFVEIEAIDREGKLGVDVIRTQAEKYQELLGISGESVLTESYIDML